MIFAVFALAAVAGAARAEGPVAVASIPPVHSLLSAVTEGVSRPHLLLGGGASPHGYALRPSDAKALAEARLVVWIGPDLERFLEGPLETLARQARKLALMKVPGLHLLPVRRGGAWEAEGHGHGHGEAEHGSAAGPPDPHIWLDPRNAIAMTEAMARTLAAIDPKNAPRYRANADALTRRLAALDRALAARLAPHREQPFVVFHDAYRYFEDRYGLASVGAVTFDPRRPPGAKRLIALKARIRASGAACVFAEPQFEPRLLATVIEGTGARSGVLDPVGAALEPGPGLYTALMGNLAKSIADCLTAR